MTSYVPGFPTVGGVPVDVMSLIELRVQSNLMQYQQGSQALDELNVLRNDQAFELNEPAPVPGTST